MASGIDRLNKLIGEDAKKKAEEEREKRYGTYTYNTKTGGYTKKGSSSSESNTKQTSSSSSSSTSKSNTTTSKSSSGIERLNSLISEDDKKKANEEREKRYGSYTYDKDTQSYRKAEVARNAASVPTSTTTNSVNSSSIPSYTRKSDEEVEALRNKRDEVKTNINKRTAEYNMKYRNGYIGNEWELKRDLDAFNAELEKLDDELRMYDYDDYLDDRYEDTFAGRFKANYAQGRLGQDSNAAWNEYYADPTEENFQFATLIDEVEEKFALLQKAKLPEKLAGKMEELSKAVENIEFEQVEDILKNY